MTMDVLYRRVADVWFGDIWFYAPLTSVAREHFTALPVIRDGWYPSLLGPDWYQRHLKDLTFTALV